MPNDWNLAVAGQFGAPGGPQGVTGPVGPTGTTGPTGPLNGTFADAPSDTYWYGRTNAAWASGGQISNNLFISAGAQSYLVLTKSAGGASNAVAVTGRVNNQNRWAVYLGDANVESGSNAGSNFSINSYDDTGTLLGVQLSISRANGQATFSQTLNVSPVGGAQINLNKSASGNNSIIYGQTNGSNRWYVLLGDGAAESGSNAGSNFSIARHGDNGVAIDAPLVINRASGNASFSKSLTVTGAIGVGASPSGGAGDLTVARSAATGVVYFGTDGGHYIASDGTNWTFAGGSALNYGGNLTIGNITCGTISNTGYWTYSGGLYSYGNLQVNGSATLGANYGSGVGTSGGGGFAYNLWAGYANVIGFAWQNLGAGYVSVFVDNGAAGYPIQGASDERVKADIAPSTLDWLSTILQIPVYEYRWKDHAVPGEPVYDPDAELKAAGLIAQRVYEVAPHCVIKGDDSPQLRSKAQIEEARQRRPRADTTEPGPPGGDVNTGNTLWTIDTNNLLATLIGAVQQLTKRVEELEARLA